MNETRWIDRSQPERLQQATMMLYITAAFDVFSALLSASALTLLFLIIAAVKVAGGYGIANEKKAGYYAGTGGAIASLVLALALLPGNPVLGLFGVAIDAWVVSLLLHETSRGYQRIWFK
jgi:small neutral amino acid transporter SnatA (MarC family)